MKVQLILCAILKSSHQHKTIVLDFRFAALLQSSIEIVLISYIP